MVTQRCLLRTLEEKGALLPEWRDTVAAVDRARFVPEVFEGVNFAEDSERWAASVYSDAPLVTQVNDGEALKDGGFRLATSSSSMPSIMLEMLGLLEVGSGHRVLEIGTGTGYHAAWLCHRLDDSNVITVEIDPAVLTVAVANLREAGYRPVTVLGEGRHGHRTAARPPGRPRVLHRSVRHRRAVPVVRGGRRQRGGHAVAPRRRPEVLGDRRVRPRTGNVRGRAVRPPKAVGRGAWAVPPMARSREPGAGALRADRRRGRAAGPARRTGLGLLPLTPRRKAAPSAGPVASGSAASSFAHDLTRDRASPCRPHSVHLHLIATLKRLTLH
ncbi:DUF938 domain-containing protein [Streptomyces eurocidicus]|uniref:DUF938 domain-containing protein n=1 Tax=Streptomyces eurocidicus TaxID=66423 RepID=UPI001E3415A0|nr:DUF938 domain-containing protein [Streptomyces eurocidicus]